MNIVDAIILVFVLLGAVVGFSRGFFKQTVMFVGTILIVVLAFLLKNPLSLLLYENLPFFNFGGLTSLNILLYEILAFIIALAILSIALTIVIKLTGIVETVLKLTVILALPSKLLGMIVGMVQSIVILYVALFIVSLPMLKVPYINESKYAKLILEKTPIISGITNDVVKTFNEISVLTEEIKGTDNTKKANRDIVEVMLKNKVTTSKSIKLLVDKNKITLENAQELIDKYKED